MRVDAESTAAGESTPAKGGGDNYLTAKGGIMSWVVTIDHKRIGVMYLAGITGTLLLGGLFAMLLRFELWTPSPAFMTDAQYNHSFTLHGAIMTFLFIIPGIPAVIGNFVLPIMLGAKDMAFPRINLLSWYLWVLGGLFFVLVLFFGGLDTGWTFYTPYSTSGGGAANIRSQGAVVLATAARSSWGSRRSSPGSTSSRPFTRCGRRA
jgi:cytochrome c oxidase subunit 1